MTDEEYARSEKRIEKSEKRYKFFGSVFSELRTIIYTPLSIAFHAVSYVAKGIGYISSFGLIAGVYYLYQSFCAFKSGVARQVQVIEIVRGIHESLVTHHFAVIVDEDIAHDGVYPSFEISIGRILLFVIQSFQGCFLQEVVGFFTVGSKFVCKTQ